MLDDQKLLIEVQLPKTENRIEKLPLVRFFIVVFISPNVEK